MDSHPYKIYRLAEFSAWLTRLDPDNKAMTLARIEKMARGTFGDSAPVGRGVSEARIHEAAGLRIYYIVQGKTIILLMHGGFKGSQVRDIKKAHEILDRLIAREKDIREKAITGKD